MTVLPFNFDIVLNTFQHPNPLTCIDYRGEYVNGVWTDKEIGRRLIRAIVLAMPTDRLEFHKEGDSSIAGIVLHTKAMLWWNDVKNAGQEQRQSYIEYQGYRFRVAGTGFMIGNANYHTYEAIRHLR